MARVDVEIIFKKMFDHFKANLNTEIVALNTEKADSLTLEQIDSAAWIEGSLNETVKNFNTFVLYYVENYDGTMQGNSISKNISIEFDILISQKEDFLDYTRLLRYHRVLEDVAKKAWDNVGKGFDRATISLLTPIDVKLFDSAYWHKVVGVRIEFNLVN